MFKLPYNCTHFTCARLCSKSFKLGFNSTWTSRCTAGFKKDRGTGDQIANTYWITEKARKFKKIIYFCFIDFVKASDCVDHNKLKNSSRDENTRPPYLSPEKTVNRIRSKLESYTEQWTGSKLGKQYVKAVHCHLAYLTSRPSTLCKMPGLMTHKLESRLLGEISITSDIHITSPSGRKWRGTKEPLDEVEEGGEWKSWLKTQHSKN